MKTFEELQKEVHEKLVYWIGNNGLKVECIILFPGGSDILTVTPIEEDIEALVKRFHVNYDSRATVEIFSKPDFCLAELSLEHKNPQRTERLEKISRIKNGGDFNFYEITGRSKLSTIMAGDPSCPHGN